MKDYMREPECKFYVNEDKRKVVCVYDVEENLFGACYADSKYLNIDLENINDIIRDEMPTKHFVGVATCSPEDEWNEAIGRRIAFLKVREKYYRSYFKTANRIIDRIDEEIADIACAINDLGERVEDSVYREKERIEQVLHE